MEHTQQQATVQQPAAVLPEQDIVDFVLAHPGMDMKTMPQHIWDDVKKGDKLANAYDRHELQQLRRSNRQLQQQVGMLQSGMANRRNAPGSMRSAGGFRATDSFLEGFNED